MHVVKLTGNCDVSQQTWFFMFSKVRLQHFYLHLPSLDILEFFGLGWKQNIQISKGRAVHNKLDLFTVVV